MNTLTAEHPQPLWHVLLRPRWLAWHGFAVVAFFGMMALGDWQLHRALSGNELSWAYTFEWPLFALFGVYFWFRTCRDELKHAAQGTSLSKDLPGGATATAEAAPTAAEVPAEDSEDYVARLRAEIQRDPRWRGGSRRWR